MNEVRQTLLSDYKINPELIAMCEHEIKDCVQDRDKLEEGEVVHCLMDMARTKSRKKAPDNRVPMSAQCQRAVSWSIAVIIIYCTFIYFSCVPIFMDLGKLTLFCLGRREFNHIYVDHFIQLNIQCVRS